MSAGESTSEEDGILGYGAIIAKWADACLTAKLYRQSS